MPAFETMDRLQTVVIYRPAGTNRYGRATVSAGEELTVRLRQGLNDSFQEEDQTISISASMVTDELLVNGTIVWEGALADLPAEPTGLLVVVNTSKVPDIKNRNVRYTAQLSRFNDAVPEIA